MLQESHLTLSLDEVNCQTTQLRARLAFKSQLGNVGAHLTWQSEVLFAFSLYLCISMKIVVNLNTIINE